MFTTFTRRLFGNLPEEVLQQRSSPKGQETILSLAPNLMSFDLSTPPKKLAVFLSKSKRS